MCTIVALVSAHPEFPVILATNRDEFYARPSLGPGRILRSPSAVGGRDAVARGTWMGVTETGFFAGVTNQRTLRPSDPTKRSRGALVMEALALADSERVRAHVEGLDGRAYNGFNLMWGDAHGLFVAYGREDTLAVHIEPVPPGVHVLPNDRLDSGAFFKVHRALELAEDVRRLPFPACADGLARLLADSERPPIASFDHTPEGSVLSRELLRELSALCVRTPAYGTRASSIVALEPGGVGHYLYADGAPDQAPFVDVRPLFKAPPPPPPE